jgi:NAD(P)-dependent dehydrogenase (short-subunit alcohol dehydrogenase family)
VTGVSTGIGWGTTKVLIANGYRVFGSVRKQADAEQGSVMTIKIGILKIKGENI